MVKIEQAAQDRKTILATRLHPGFVPADMNVDEHAGSPAGEMILFSFNEHGDPSRADEKGQQPSVQIPVDLSHTRASSQVSEATSFFSPS